MRGYPIPEVRTTQLYDWAVKLVSYLRMLEREIENPSPQSVQLEHAKDTASAARDGVMMWDAITGSVIVSKGGQWHSLTMAPIALSSIKDKKTR